MKRELQGDTCTGFSGDLSLSSLLLGSPVYCYMYAERGGPCKQQCNEILKAFLSEALKWSTYTLNNRK